MIVPEIELESLVKAVHKSHLAGIADSSNHKDKLVDHKAQALHAATVVPESFKLYDTAIKNSKNFVEPSFDDGFAEGVSSKQIFPHMAHRFMVKPYAEKIPYDMRQMQRWPIAGWAEVANQSLFHAAGLGKYHQSVHIAHHMAGNPSKTMPVCVIHTTPGMDTFSNFGKLRAATSETKDAMRKINIMDFLTNNLDRHNENMLTDPDCNIMAIDHGRSFQYLRDMDTKWKTSAPEADDVRSYLFRSFGASEHVLPAADAFWGDVGEQKQVKESPYVKVINGWWKENSSAIQDAMKHQLTYIKNEKVRNHIWNNFKVRADMLDNWAELGLENVASADGNRDAWLYQPVPMIPFKE